METEFLGSDPDSIQCEALQHLHFSLQGSELLAKWFVLPSNKHCIQLCTVKTNRTGSPVISFTIEILVNFEWLLRIPQGILDWKNHPMLMQLPLHIKTVDDAMKIINEIDNAKHCDGIMIQNFISLSSNKKEGFFIVVVSFDALLYMHCSLRLPVAYVNCKMYCSVKAMCIIIDVTLFCL